MTRLAEVVIKVPPCFEGGPLEKSTPPRWFPFPGIGRGGGLFLEAIMLFWILIGCAAHAAPLAGSADEMVQKEEAIAEPIPLSQAELLDEGVALRRIGAFDEADVALQQAASLTEGLNKQVQYQIGVLHEVQERWSEAIDVYEAVAERWPGTETAADARFRRAYCLEELGDHKAATGAVKALQRDGKWSADDQRTMNLQRGITELRAGQERKGIRRILKQLSSGEDDRSWIRAKARLALVRAQVSAAQSVALVGDRKAARRLKQRASLISAAENQAIVMFNLGEPEFALEGLLLLGDAYLALYEDMLSYPPPKSITPAEHEAYRDVVEQKAAILKAKAHARYDEGVRVAARTQWVGSVTQRLMKKRDATRDAVVPDQSSDAVDSSR